MTRQELASALAAKTNLSKSQAINAVECIIDILKETLTNGENIYLRGFGTLKIERRAAKKARIIQTGEFCMVAEHNVVKFVSAPDLKNKV